MQSAQLTTSSVLKTIPDRQFSAS